ncbi:unnamed protein product [Arctia plantaginis]|uniref:Uncharacterized protein n=1 Tax=Arctia plantaginis TaxID=874455 RepID=A0A8S0ZRM8_ARCPL|nr:unnamed protein product [Arctia plantaginis]
MVEVRACFYFSVLFLCFHLAAGKPFLGFLFCDFLCDDDDDSSTTTTASTEDPWDIFMCGGCGTRRPRTTTTPSPLMPNPMQTPINFVIPASSNAMNLTWYPGSNGFFMMPWNQGGAPPANGAAGSPPPTTAAPATTAASTAAAPAA